MTKSTKFRRKLQESTRDYLMGAEELQLHLNKIVGEKKIDSGVPERCNVDCGNGTEPSIKGSLTTIFLDRNRQCTKTLVTIKNFFQVDCLHKQRNAARGR